MLRVTVLWISLLLLNACDPSLPSYLFTQGLRQGSMIIQASAVEEWLKKPDLSPQTRARLELSQKVLEAAAELGLQSRNNYKHYVELDRPWVTQVVSAAHPDRLESHLFHFPIFGKLPYKGFFDETQAIEFENSLKSQGLDTIRRGVDAFSSAGWLHDPLTSSMISKEHRMIELIFHELVHSTFFFKSHADFNEAFATWFGNLSALEFALKHSLILSEAQLTLTRLENNHHNDLLRGVLINRLKDHGKEMYAQNGVAARQEYFQWVKQQATQNPALSFLHNSEINNASITSLGNYYDLIPAIDHYAQVHSLSPKEFLALVVKSGPKIISKITEHQAASL